MEQIIKGNKHTFWQALVIALIIFFIGIILGIFFENYRTSRMERFYISSETEIFDIQLGSDILNMFEFDCDFALKETIGFADRVYEEAKTLEKYDASNKITEDIANVHKRYDLLRTALWRDAIKLQEKCPGKTNVIVYLYEYMEPTINTQAKQITLSKVLLDLKKKYEDKVILIPIAYDSGSKSLELLKQKYELTESPVVFINQKHKITELSSMEELEAYIIL